MKITYTRPDGGLSIVTAASKAALEKVLGPLTDEAYRAHVMQRSIPEGASGVQVMASDWQVPADRSFRDAWRLSGKQLAVNMPVAREIWREELRRERAKIFPRLDVDYMRAQEARDEAELRRVGEAKQKLRDVPDHPAIEAAKTPDELKALTLDKL